MSTRAHVVTTRERERGRAERETYTDREENTLLPTKLDMAVTLELNL